MKILIHSIFLTAVSCFTINAQYRAVTLAVSDLQYQGVAQSEVLVVSEQLRSELLRDTRIRMIERAQMKAVLEEKGLMQKGITSNDDAVAMGTILGVESVIVGSVGKAGSFTVLSVRVLDVKTGEIIISDVFKTRGGINQILERGVTSIASSITRGLTNTDSGTVENANQAKKKTRKILIIGGTGAVIAGCGAAVLIASGMGDKHSPKVSTNVVVFP